MISALVSGVLASDPVAATSKAGKDYVRATMRSGDGEDAVFVSLFAFGEDDAEALLSSRKGDGISASGRFQIGEFERDGVTRPSFAVFGARILTAAKPKPKRTPKPKPATDDVDPFAGTAASDLDDVPALGEDASVNRLPLSPEMEHKVLVRCSRAVAEISALAEELVGEAQVPAVRVPIAIDFQQGKLMNRRAISREQRAVLFGHLDVVVEELRKMADATVDVGPLLVEHYRCLSAIARYREVLDALPEIATAQDTEAPRA